MDLKVKRDEAVEKAGYVAKDGSISMLAEHFESGFNACAEILSEERKALKDYGDVSLKLLKAQEEIKELKEKLNMTFLGQAHFKSERDTHIKESEQFVIEAVSRIKELEKALEFYADRNNWWTSEAPNPKQETFSEIDANDFERLNFDNPDEMTGGKLARQTLSKLRGGK